MRRIQIKAVHGFSLLELMITISILAIIVAIALPNYQQSVRKARRADVMEVLSSLAHEQERFLTANGVYNVALNGTAVADASDHYTVQYGAVTVNAFTITATATGSQADDEECASFQVDHLFQRTSTDADGNVSNCW